MACVDCDRPGRPTPHPGPRCATHHRAVLKTRRLRDAMNRIEATYGLVGDEYELLKAAQGGRCAICRRATGATRRLSVDHDHRRGSGRRAVRGLLCRPCNTMLGHVRDNPRTLLRAVRYLLFPPAHPVLYPVPQQFDREEI